MLQNSKLTGTFFEKNVSRPLATHRKVTRTQMIRDGRYAVSGQSENWKNSSHRAVAAFQQ